MRTLTVVKAEYQNLLYLSQIYFKKMLISFTWRLAVNSLADTKKN
jgi:hypothetical protein